MLIFTYSPRQTSFAAGSKREKFIRAMKSISHTVDLWMAEFSVELWRLMPSHGNFLTIAIFELLINN